MKVPDPVRNLFDKFPLQQLPAVDVEKSPSDDDNELLLGVYSLDDEGFPMDPKCLEVYSLLLLLGKTPKTRVLSPYVTANETLPLVWGAPTPEKSQSDSEKPRGPSSARVLHSYSQVLKAFGGELDSKTKIYRSMLDTWVEDAWHETIMNPAHAETRSSIYADAAATSLPWPFTRLASNQLDEHLDARHYRGKQGSGDDYICTADNLHRASMALSALSTAIAAPLSSKPQLLDVMVFAYTWPIISMLSESAVAAMVPPMLRQHAQEVRSYFVNLR